MVHVLALSSWVAQGHVGLSAIAPVLQILGHTVTQLPTVQLSNHPGFGDCAGMTTGPDTLRAMITALDENGFLGAIDTILTGYLPSGAHVDVAVELIDRFDSPKRSVVVDPVLGDTPKGIYISEEAAEALRDRLVPRADILTPNAFELSWLTNQPTLTVPTAVAAAHDLGARASGARVLVTSAPFDDAQTGILSVTPSETEAFQSPRAPEGRTVPHGVGDVFSALIAAGLSTGGALGCLQTLIEHSLDAPHLRIAETADRWTTASPIDAIPLTGIGERR
ncbi:MAG: pyridoxal kinase [Pseudomonadota bacterium]